MASLDPRLATTPLILIVPDIDGSGPGHWQTIWESQHSDVRRVEMGGSPTPDRLDWVSRLAAAIDAADQPVVLAAHGLGCHAVAWWAALERPAFGSKIAGALLVAPPNLDAGIADHRMAGFGPVPKGMLPFHLAVVAGQDDPSCGYYHAQLLARFWGGECVDAGRSGHLGADSDLGAWQEGWALMAKVAAPLRLDGGRREGAFDHAVTRTAAVGVNVVPFAR
ncbi:alpha/beta hydrolase [Polymorphobacter glacialis]|uniref:Alpha/beta hydrolase n=1 Tax=Sandarakinorhabdus glacialis TaxID=1614636 RepID=A0A917E9N1_9SPHN|nr:alpha/beta hydrolase [Polymorphobacter glacialis]GGE14329.1 alpha/beta hydrolase [Polymorphobacter glacialis]